MGGTPTPLVIEVIDSGPEALGGRRPSMVVVAEPSDSDGAWLASLLDATAAERRHLAPAAHRCRRTWMRVRTVAWAVRSWSVQLRADGDPRRRSAVRQHVPTPFDAASLRLPALKERVPAGPGVFLEFSSGFCALPSGGHTAEATLALRGSWPRLPVTVQVEPWWRARSIVTVELRTRRRLRYPRRYFRAAHATARAVAETLAD